MIMEPKIEEIVGLAKDALKNPKKYACEAGISLGTTKYSRKSDVKAYVGFLVKYFNKILLFINDYNYHWDLMTFRNMDKEASLKKAKRMGDELKNNYQNIIVKYFSENKAKIKIITFFELLKDKKYQEFQERFHKILEDNKKIKDEIEKDLDDQILYTISIKEKLEAIKKNNPAFYQSAAHFCKNYVLDQLITNLYLMFRLPVVYDIRISLTPYSQFVTLKKLLEGGYDNFKERLKIFGDYGVISGIHS